MQGRRHATKGSAAERKRRRMGVYLGRAGIDWEPTASSRVRASRLLSLDGDAITDDQSV